MSTERIYTVRELNTEDFTKMNSGTEITVRACIVKMWECSKENPEYQQMILQDTRESIEATPSKLLSDKYRFSAMPAWINTQTLTSNDWLQFIGNTPQPPVGTWTLILDNADADNPRWLLKTTTPTRSFTSFTTPRPVSIPLELALDPAFNWVPIKISGKVVEFYESFNALTLEKRVLIRDSVAIHRMNVILQVDPYSTLQWLEVEGRNIAELQVICQPWSQGGAKSLAFTDNVQYFIDNGFIQEERYEMDMPGHDMIDMLDTEVDDSTDERNMPPEQATDHHPDNPSVTGEVDKDSTGDLSDTPVTESFSSGEPVSETADIDSTPTPGEETGSYDNPTDWGPTPGEETGSYDNPTDWGPTPGEETGSYDNPTDWNNETEHPDQGTNCLLDHYREEMVKYEKLKQDHETLQGQYASACQNELAIENEKLRRQLALAEEKMDNDRMRTMPPRDKEEELSKRRKEQQRLEYEKALSEQAAEEQIKKELAQAEAALLEGENEGNS